MATYSFAGRVISEDDEVFPKMAAAAHAAVPRPLCMCRTPGVEMYVARVGAHFIVKRMPDSGSLHAMSCGSYEPPPELSGLGEVLGAAIQTNVTDGTVSLKLDFSMSKKASAAPPRSVAPQGHAADHVRADGAKLSLRSTLHYLWSEAGFHRWSPAMTGKRSWFVIRKYLLQAAQDKLIKGRGLEDVLYIPEAFAVDKKDAIARRRQAAFTRFASSEGQSRPLMLLVAEVKEIAEARFGKKLILKQVPDCAFMLRDDIAGRLLKRFSAELDFWNALDDLHLLVFGTFSVSQNGIPSMEELTLMLTTDQWLPVEGQHDKTLVDSLVKERRRFDKGLRYNLPPDRPLASAVLTDTGEPIAMYLIDPQASERYRLATQTLQQESSLTSWTWMCTQEEMPALPPGGKGDGLSGRPT